MSTALFWGGTFVAGRLIADTVGPFSAAFLRFLVASICLFLLTHRLEGRLPRLAKRQITQIVLLGLTGVFSYNAFFFYGLKMIEASRAALIIANNPIAIALLAALIFGEKLTPIKGLGIILSVTGAVIVISRGDLSELLRGEVGWGEISIFCCVLSWSAFSIIGKAVMTDLSPMVSITYSSLVGTTALLLPACMEGMILDIPGYTLTDWGSIAYLGFFGTVLGFVWYYQGIRAIGPTKASQFINFVPISAILLAFFVLQETITRSLLIGAAFVITGVYLTNKKNPPTRP